VEDTIQANMGFQAASLLPPSARPDIALAP